MALFIKNVTKGIKKQHVFKSKTEGHDNLICIAPFIHRVIQSPL